MIKYNIYTSNGELFETKFSYEEALSCIKKDLDKFTIIADGYTYYIKVRNGVYEQFYRIN